MRRAMKYFTHQMVRRLIRLSPGTWLLAIAILVIPYDASAQTVVAGEYFFDTDPGTGNATALALTPAASINQSFNIPTGALGPGFHTFNARVKDNTGKWSLTTTRSFYAIPNPFSGTPALTITRAEYFFDSDPGRGNGTAIPVTAASAVTLAVDAPTASLAPGFHTISVRARDDQGQWSLFTTRSFYLLPSGLLSPNLVKLEYFVDTDPGIGQATSVTLTATPAVNQLFNLDLPVLAPGTYTLHVRAKDSNGYWSNVLQEPFTIIPCTPPAAPTATDASRCGPGTVTLSANGATGAQEYRWYADAISSTILFTGQSFITPPLNGNATFFVSIYDPATCESNRTDVTVTLNPSSCTPPVITPVPLTTQIEGQVALDLIPLITTSSALDIASIIAVGQPLSGAVVTVVNGMLMLDYTGKSFSGTDEVTIRACDVAGNCTEQLFEIQVVGELVIYNALSPNGDGLNDAFILQYIDVIPEKQSNRVTIYNRWGDVVFEVSNYNNTDRVFTGVSDAGKELPSGTYYYRIRFSSGTLKTGYISLKR